VRLHRVLGNESGSNFVEDLFADPAVAKVQTDFIGSGDVVTPGVPEL
jgi:hypothetical protein